MPLRFNLKEIESMTNSESKKKIKQSKASFHHRKSKLEQVKSDNIGCSKVEEVLHQNEQLYRAIFEGSRDAIFITAEDSRFVAVNEAASVLTGYSREELKKMTIPDLHEEEDRHAYRQFFHRIMSGEQVTSEAKILRKNGTKVDTEFSNRRVTIGDVAYMHTVARDITERKEAERARQETEEQFRAVFDNTLVGLYRTTPDGRILMANPVLIDMLGYSSFEILSKRNLEKEGYEPQYPRSIFKERIESEGKVTGFESAWKKSDGTTLYVRESAQAVRDEFGKVKYYQGTVEDITNHKKTELALQESEEKYRQLFETEMDAIMIFDAETREFLDVNDAAVRLYGYSRDEFLKLTQTDITVEKRASDISIKQTSESNPVRIPLRYHKKKDGAIFPVEISGSSFMFKGRKVLCGVVRDITLRKIAEEMLRESENRYRAVVENAAEGIAVVHDGILKYVNPHLIAITGYTEKELMSRFFIEFVHPDDRERIMEIHLNRNQGKEVPLVYELRIFDKQGETKWLENSGILIDWEGKPATLNFLRDVTGRKKTEEQLKESEERFRSLSNAAFEGIAIIKDGRLVDANAAFTNLFGYTLDEIIGKEIQMLVAPEDRQLVMENVQSGYEKPYEHKALRKDGSILNLEVCGKTVLIKGQRCRITAIRDITERKKTEEQLLEYQAKLKSLASQLSVIEERERHRIATELHDQIGQSLVFSKTKLDSMRGSISSGELADSLEEVCDCLGQVIQDTRSLTFDLSYPILYELGFETAVSEWLDVKIGKNHGIKTEFEDDGKSKPLDDDIRALLFRNVRELLINVVKHAEARKVKVSICKVDSQICISVEDDGIGIKPDKIKSLSVGDSGFGIFSIREWLEQLGGHLEIDSEEGVGSKITMKAPLKLTKSKGSPQDI
jgi:PAS domain S-box-containing protein